MPRVKGGTVTRQRPFNKLRRFLMIDRIMRHIQK